MLQGAQLFVDSGDLYDKTFRGGRLGVLAFSQDLVTYSALRYRCLEVRDLGIIGAEMYLHVVCM